MRRLFVLVGLVVALGAGAATPVRAGGGTLYEKATTLDESLAVAQRLRGAGIEVVLTRTDDSYVGLSPRAAAARGADLLVSMHNNASTSRGVVGTEAYYQIGNQAGARLASDIVDAVSSRAGTVRRGAFTRKGDNGDYYLVLRESPATAIIVEGAFLSNPGEAKRLADPAFRRSIADGVADAILRRYALPAVEQGGGPPPALPLAPAPTGVRAAYLGGHNVELAWNPVAMASAYEVWRDGYLLGRVSSTTTTARDGGLAVGRHVYAVRTVVDRIDHLHQVSAPARVLADVPWRIVIDPGHGGREPGAVGRF